MQQPDTRLTAERRREDGEWEVVCTALIGDKECKQIALILAGIDPGTFAALPAAAQKRITRKIWAGESPVLAMD